MINVKVPFSIAAHLSITLDYYKIKTLPPSMSVQIQALTHCQMFSCSHSAWTALFFSSLIKLPGRSIAGPFPPTHSKV